MEKRVLLKIGGRAFEGDDAFAELAQAIKSADAEVIIVHGGGAEISSALKAAQRETVFVDGVRVTQKEDVAIVEQVLSDTINGRIAAALAGFGIDCARMSGKTGGLMIAEKTLRNGKDIGFVGKIVRVNPAAALQALAEKRLPVVSPISANEDGLTFNVNADTAAAALAVGTFCTDLVYFSDVPGVLDDQQKLIPSLTIDAGRRLIQTGIISGGMVAKMESIFNAISQGVERVHISQWQGPETLQLVLNGDGIDKTTIQNS